ncbi:hypothetical protein CF328_g7913 [Tilletia controversa]|nr:hypothetical protein CF328_g7913 [Tilletia controversa]
MASTRHRTGASKSYPLVFSSSSEAATSPALSQVSDSSLPVSISESVREPWTTHQMVALVDFLKDSIPHQVMFLPGHNRGHPIKGSHMQGATMIRALRSHVFPEGTNKTVDGIKAKISAMVKKYRQHLTAMSQTGQGLLLDEMYDGPVKTAREQLLEEYPWWETMHIMMRDRASSDPSTVVTGAGEISTTTGSASTSVESQGEGEDEAVVLGLRSQTSGRGRKRAFDFDEDDRNDAFSEDDSEDGQTNTSTPRASGSRLPQRLYIPGKGPLPTLGRLANATSTDPMSKGSVQKEAGDSTSPTARMDKGKAKVVERLHPVPVKLESAPKPKPTHKHARSSVVDGALDEFGRTLAEERQQRAHAQALVASEREQTKRLKIELQAQNRDKEKDLFDCRLNAQAIKLEAIHNDIHNTAQAVSQLTSSINTFMGKVDIVTMVLQHLMPSGSSGRPSVAQAPN